MPATECYQQIAVRLGELHKRLKRTQSQMLEEYHVSLMEYHILTMMLHSQQLSQNDLASALDVNKALISRQIQAMEKKGLLQSRTDPDCRRRKTLTLSESALSLLPQLEEIHRRSLAYLFADLTEEQLCEFQNILEGLVCKL